MSIDVRKIENDVTWPVKSHDQWSLVASEVTCHLPRVLSSSDVTTEQSAQSQLQMRERQAGIEPGTQNHLVQVDKYVGVILGVN